MRPWMVDRRAHDEAHAELLQWGHGLAAVDGCPLAGLVALAAELQWGHGLAAVDGGARVQRCLGARRGFNGATALRPWMARRDVIQRAAMAKLQWGHGLAAVDGCMVASGR